MDFAGGNIQVFFGPKEHGAASDPEKTIVKFIDEARDSLDIAIQELDNERITEAILRAARRKKTRKPKERLSIRMILEEDYLREAKPPAPGKKPQYDLNRSHFTSLLRSAVPAKIDLNPNIFHHKFVVRDYLRDRQAVLTGSTNFTETGCHSNLNAVFIFHNEPITRLYRSEFLEMRHGAFGIRSPARTSPKPVDVGGAKVQVLFAPDDNPEVEIMKRILKAEDRVDFMMFTFAGSSGIDDALLRRLEGAKPLRVRGVLDRDQSKHRWSPRKRLANAGASIRVQKKRVRKLHHKLMVVDDRYTIGGSFNYTEPANRLNDENLFIIEDPQIARYVRREIDRVYDELAVEPR